MTNQERAEIAKGLAEAFAQMTGMRHENAQTVATDLVCDLMHYVRAEGGDPFAVLTDGQMHFDAEEEEGDYAERVATAVYGPADPSDAEAAS